MIYHDILGIYKIKVGYKNCIEGNKIVQIQRNNNYSWLYFFYQGRPEKGSLLGTGILTPKWQMRKFQISYLVEEM